MSSDTYFTMTTSALLILDPDLNISNINKRLVISNISEETFEKLPFVTNNPVFRGHYSIDKVEYFVNNNLQPIFMAGLSEIHQGRFRLEDSNAYKSGNTFFNPFTNIFEDGLTYRDVLTLLSKLSFHTANIKPTDTIKYRITMKSK